MQIGDPSSQAILALSQASREKFNSIKKIAKHHAVSMTGIHFYVAIGSLNFYASLLSNIDKIQVHEVIYTGVKPKQAAGLLACDSKEIARWCMTLTKRKLLIREPGGAYKVSDVKTWYEISQLINEGEKKSSNLSDQ
jgi:hypothetical protein